VARDRKRSLERQLDALALAMELESDFTVTYLEPWHGVGVYAAMFGCPVEWSHFDAPQTWPIYHSVEELEGLEHPDILGCEMSRMVIETIYDYREKTDDRLDLVLTDTQSPNDSASLIMDTSEFFTYNRLDPERIAPLLGAVTQAIIEFSELQLEAIGEKQSRPGHNQLSGRRLSGISISDDNMSFLSPRAYADCALEYNSRLGEHFTGVAIHTCGNFAHNFEVLKQVKGLTMVDCALRGVDPLPNEPGQLAKAFANSGIVLTVRMGLEEDWSFLDELIRPDVKVVFSLQSDGEVGKSNAITRGLKEHCQRVLERNIKDGGKYGSESDSRNV
jgi:uroporphyrinogen-III decarboxylase